VGVRQQLITDASSAVRKAVAYECGVSGSTLAADNGR